MTRTWRDNAHEFGALTKQGYGVRLGVLVACSVEKSQGRRTSAGSRKSSLAEFARESGVGEATVRSHLNKWDRMVEAGWDLDRQDMGPEDAEHIELSDEFIAEYDALATAGVSGSGLTGKAADIAKNTGAMAEAIQADPRVAEAARGALYSLHSPSGSQQRIANDPDLKHVRASNNAFDEFRHKVTGPLGEAAAALDVASRNVDDLWEGASEVQRSLATERLIAIYATVGTMIESYVSAGGVR